MPTYFLETTDVGTVIKDEFGLTSFVTARQLTGQLWPPAVEGLTGETGPPGAIAVYEQPGDPGVVAVGSVWIDTDDPGIMVDKNFVYTQSSAATTWSVAHNLGKFPAVDVVDSGGNWLVADVNYVDINNLTVSFAGATSGKVYCN